MIRLLTVLVLVGASVKAGLRDTEQQFIAKYGEPSSPFADGVTKIPIDGGPIDEKAKDNQNFVLIYKQVTNEITVLFKDGKVDSIICEKKSGSISEEEFKSFRDQYSSGAVFARDMSLPQGMTTEEDKQSYLNTVIIYRSTQTDQSAAWFKSINKMAVKNGKFDPVVIEKPSQP